MELARPRNSWANAQESAAAFCAALSRSEEGPVVSDYFIRNFKPDGYTRHSRCFPPGKEERSWAPGYPETGGNKKEPLLCRGVPERGPRDSSRFVPMPPACTTQLGPQAPRCPGGTRRPLDTQTPQGALTWRVLGRQRRWSMPAAGGFWAPGSEGTGQLDPAPRTPALVTT